MFHLIILIFVLWQIFQTEKFLSFCIDGWMKDKSVPFISSSVRVLTSQKLLSLETRLFFFFSAALGLSWNAQNLLFSLRHAESFSCGIWELGPWPGIDIRPPALGVWSLSHWTSREVQTSLEPLSFYCLNRSYGIEFCKTALYLCKCSVSFRCGYFHLFGWFYKQRVDVRFPGLAIRPDQLCYLMYVCSYLYLPLE